MRTRTKGYQRLKNGQLLSQPRDPLTGRRVRITAGTLGELEHKTRKVAAVREGLRWGELDPKQAARVLYPAKGKRCTVGECWERYFPGVPVRSKAIARSTWARRLEPYFADAQVWELDKTRMAAWAAKLEAERFASKTIRSAYDWLSGAVSVAVDDGIVDGWPWGNWRPKRPVVLKERERCTSVDELARLLEAARELDARDWQEGRYADRVACLTVLALCGLRQGEACALAWDHVDLFNGTMHVQYQAARGWPGRFPDGRPRDPCKTRPRIITLHDDARRALVMQLRALERRGWYRDSGPVFPNLRGTFRTSARVFRPDALRALVVAAGLPNVEAWTTHSMRHTFATLEAVGHGGDLRAAQARTGHASLKQLEHYLHQAGRGLVQSAIPRLPPALLPEVPPLLGTVEVHEAHAVHPEDAAPPRVHEPTTTDTQEIPSLASVLGETERSELAAEAAREETARDRRRQAARPFEDIAREWLAADRPGPRPPAVTRAVRDAYVRAYKAELAKGTTGERWEALSHEARELIDERDPEHASKLRADHERRKEAARGAGRRARRASLGAWGQALKRAERARHTEAAEAQALEL